MGSPNLEINSGGAYIGSNLKAMEMFEYDEGDYSTTANYAQAWSDFETNAEDRANEIQRILNKISGLAYELKLYALHVIAMEYVVEQVLQDNLLRKNNPHKWARGSRCCDPRNRDYRNSLYRSKYLELMKRMIDLDSSQNKGISWFDDNEIA